MYNRYLPPDAVYDPVPWEEEEAPPSQLQHAPTQPHGPPQPPPRSTDRNEVPRDLPNSVVQQATRLLSGLFKHFSPENLDTGDILLVLIVLFLFLEKEDNLDLAIALGLMLLLSLGESDEQALPES